MWTASMHGDTDHLDPEVAQEAESDLRERLAAVFGDLVEAGHQGISGVFHFSKGGPSDLTGPGAPTHRATPSDVANPQIAAADAPDVRVPDEPRETPPAEIATSPPPAE